MAIILASFSTSSAEDFRKKSERASQGKTPVSMVAPIGQSIAGNLRDTLPEADTLEVVDFVVSGLDDSDNSKWVNAYGFTEPTSIEAKQVYLEVPNEDIDTSLDFLNTLLGLVWIDGEFENGLTLKMISRAEDASDENIATQSRIFEEVLNREIADTTSADQEIETDMGQQNSEIADESSQKKGKLFLYAMGFVAVGGIYYAYKKSTSYR